MDPIINLGVPVVQAYLQGLALRQQREQDLARQAMREREFLFTQQQTGIGNQRADAEMALRRQQFDASQANWNTDNARQQAELDFRRNEYDTGRADEMAARRANTAMMMPDLAGGLASGQSQDPFADMEQIAAFGAAPSAAQRQIMRDRDANVMQAREMAKQFAKAKLQRTLVGIAAAPFGPEQKKQMEQSAIDKYFEEGGEPLGVGEMNAAMAQPEQQMTPEMLSQYASDLRQVNPMATPERATAAVRLRAGGFPIGLGDANLSGQTRSEPVTKSNEYEALKLDLADAEDELRSLERQYSSASPSNRAPLDAQLAGARERVRAARDAMRSQLRAQPSGPKDAIDALIDQMTPEQMMQFLNGAPR